MNDLRDLFHRLRDEEQTLIRPSGTFSRSRGRRTLRQTSAPLSRLRERVAEGRVRVWAFAAIVIIAIAIGAIAIHHRRPPAQSIVTWKAPTDFLLRTPGSELLSTVPQIPERNSP
jgi:hypothetical protein